MNAQPREAQARHRHGAATLAVAGAATITGTGSANAASGGGCRAWFNYAPYGQDVQARPCISASGLNINGSGYLLGSTPVDELSLLLVDANGVTWDQRDANCSGMPAGDCTALDNVTFTFPPYTGQPPASPYHVEMEMMIGGNWYGPVDSPVLNFP